MVMMSGHRELGCVDQDQHAAGEAPDVRQRQPLSTRDLLEQVPPSTGGDRREQQVELVR